MAKWRSTTSSDPMAPNESSRTRFKASRRTCWKWLDHEKLGVSMYLYHMVYWISDWISDKSMYLLLYWISNWIHVPITLYHIHIISYHITSCTLAIILFPFTLFHNKVCVSCSHALLQLFRPEDLMPRGVLAMFVQRSACPHSACLTRAVWQLKPRCSQVKFDRWRWDDVLAASDLLDLWSIGLLGLTSRGSRGKSQVLGGFESGRVAVFRSFFPDDSVSETGDKKKKKTLEEASPSGWWAP